VLLKFDQPYRDLRVLGLIADMAACGYYRMEYPFEFLRRGGAKADTTGAVNLPLLQEYDIIVVQRSYSPELFGMLQEARRFGKTVLYEVDDYLHGVHPHSPAYKTFRPNGINVHWVDQWLKGSAGLLTSTPELAGAYGPLVPRTWVLPNNLDFGIRNWDRPASRDPRLEGKLVIGWAGSSFHPDDMLPLQGSLKKVLEKYGSRVVFAIASGPAQVRQFLQPLNLPSEQVVILDPVHFWDYPQLLSQFDIGLAPLSNTLFNRCKSELKLLEYGAWGIPYVASKVAPYNRFHLASGGHGGYLATNTQEWEAALGALVEDPNNWGDRHLFIKDYVRDQHDLAKAAYLWAGSLRQARDLAQYQPELRLTPATAGARTPGRNDRCPCESGNKYKKCCSPAYG
jgi:hypothetical protein